MSKPPPKVTPKKAPPRPPTRPTAAKGYQDGLGRLRIQVELQGKMAQLYAGELSVADMDNEELARMQFKDRNGRFTGRPPAALPSQLVNMIRRELLDRLAEKRRAVLEEMQDVLIGIARGDDEEAKPGDRIKAATAIIDRELGKTPETIKMETGEKGFNVTLAKAVKIKRISAEEDE